VIGPDHDEIGRARDEIGRDHDEIARDHDEINASRDVPFTVHERFGSKHVVPTWRHDVIACAHVG